MQAVFVKILNMSLTGSIVIAVVLLARLTLKTLLSLWVPAPKRLKKLLNI